MRPVAKLLITISLSAGVLRADEPLDVRETPVGTTAAVVVETITASPDGRRLAYAAREGDKLLLVVDGKSSSKPYEGFAVNGIVFSPDAKRVAAMVSPSADKWLLLVDGEAGEPYDVFVKDSLSFSADSRHVAVVAAKGPKRHAVVDGVAGQPFDDVKAFAFAPVAGPKGQARFAYAARVLESWTVVTDTGEPSRRYNAIGDGPIRFSPDGKRLVFTAKAPSSLVRPPAGGPEPAGEWFVQGLEGTGFHNELPPAGLRFSPDGGKLAYAARTGDTWQVLVDGKPSSNDEYEQVVPESIAWKADGSLVFAARSAAGWAVVDAGKPGPRFDELVFPPALTADRKHVAYVGSRGERHVVVADGKESEPSDQVMEPPVLSADGRVAYAARRGRQQFVVMDGKECPAFDAVGRLAFSPDGKRLAYGAQRGGDSVIRIGERETLAFSGFLPRTRLVFEGDLTLHAQTFRGEQLLQVTVRLGADDEEP